MQSTLSTNPDFKPNMRRLRAVVTVAEIGGVMRAAEALHLSQPSVTRAVRELESSLGVELFQRHRNGMICTEIGEIVVRRLRRALGHLTDAEAGLAALEPKGNFERLAQRLSYRQLRVLVALSDFQVEPLAAAHLNLTQPAISSNLRDLERQLGIAVFLRTQQGMRPTQCGALLTHHAKVALRELCLISQDLHAWQDKGRGQLVIGALPMSSSLLVPRALDRLTREMPGVKATLIDGTYESLLTALRNGEIDILVGALRENPGYPEITQTALYEDRLAVVARHDHPLARRDDLTLKDLRNAQWIAPRQGTPARNCFEKEFHDAGLEAPEIGIEAGNLIIIRSLLLDSDRITLISPHQVHFEVHGGQLTLLPVPLKGSQREIGMLIRNDSKPSQPLNTLCQILADIGSNLTLTGGDKRRFH